MPEDIFKVEEFTKVNRWKSELTTEDNLEKVILESIRSARNMEEYILTVTKIQ